MRGADFDARDTALMAVRHAHHVHRLLVIRAVVVHHAQQRDVVMRRGPEHARGVHQIAVVLDVDAQPPVSHGWPARRRRPPARHTLAVPTGCADKSIVRVGVPETERPVAHKRRLGHERPVGVLDLRPQLRAQPRGADRGRVPRVGGRLARLLEQALAIRGQRGAPLAQHAAPIVGQQPSHRLDERRQRRLGVGGDGQIDFGVALQILIVGLGEQIAGGDADQLRARLGGPPRASGQLIAIGIHRAPEIRQLEAEHDVRVGDERARVVGVVERMPRREIQPSPLVDDRRLQRLGQLDQTCQPRRRSRRAVGNQHRRLRGDEQPRRFGHGAGVSLRRRAHR